MGQIFKISAGVIIGLLVFQIIAFQQNTGKDYTEHSKNLQDAQNLKNQLILLTNSIHSYYRKNKKLPEFISDLKCRDIFNNRQPMACASVLSNGVFYVKYKNDWAAAEPYILDKKVFNKCKTSISFAEIDDSYRDCAKLDINSIPRQKTPEFNCNTASNDVEKIICSSDRLIAIDVKLSSIYKYILSKSPDDKKQEVKDDKATFIQLRNSKCNTSSCIKRMTTSKITRLELLGVKNPKKN